MIGAGEHAKVVISTLSAAGQQPVAVFDDSPSKIGTEVLGVPVEGPIVSIDHRKFDFGVIAIGSNSIRKQIASKLDLAWLTVSHPGACVHPL